MRHSSLRTRSLRLAMAGALAALFAACGDSPLVAPQEGPQFGHLRGGEGHGPSEADPTITVVDQPEVSEGEDEEQRCTISYAFRIENADGRVEVRTIWEGGDHDGETVDSFGPISANRVNGVNVERSFTHENDGHSFDGLRLQLWQVSGGPRGSSIVADALTDGERSTCRQQAS